MLEQALGGDDVVAHVVIELVSPARPDARLPGQVVHDVGAFQGGGEVGVDQVELFEREVAVTPSHLEVLLLAGAPVVVGEAVDADDVMTVGQKPLAEVGSDETRRAGDNRFHRVQA